MKFDLAHIWASMGLMSRSVALALVLMAIASVAVVVERLLALGRMNRETRLFTSEAREAVEAWDTAKLVEVAERYPMSAVAKLCAAGLRRFRRALAEDGNLTPVELARREIERKREAISADLRRGLSVLASVGSVAPFVGLLGTVVGIIGAFQSIATSGSGGLGAVSAGIAEALIVTAFGLTVAIPAVLCFNYLSTRLTAIERALERSAGELCDKMENDHGRNSGDRLSEAA
jgi:biopolymer transport protein ExbB